MGFASCVVVFFFLFFLESSGWIRGWVLSSGFFFRSMISLSLDRMMDSRLSVDETMVQTILDGRVDPPLFFYFIILFRIIAIELD